MSVVRNNLMSDPLYRPYCGRDFCWARLNFDGEQFTCACGYRTQFPDEFIAEYVAKWNAKAEPIVHNHHGRPI